MARIRPLSRPPITEAVIDVQARFADRRDLQDFASFGAAIADAYPTKQTRKQIELRIDSPAERVQKTSDAGYVYRSAEGLDVVQTRYNGITFSRLSPYLGWEQTFDEGWRVWQLYREMFRPARITRLSTRYINQLKLPGPSVDFDDYLLAGPRLPEAAPERIASFSTFIAIPEIRAATRAMVRQVFDGMAADMTTVPMLLDIDVVRECDIDPFDEDHTIDALRELRAVKNEVFFGCLTEKAVSLFE